MRCESIDILTAHIHHRPLPDLYHASHAGIKCAHAWPQCSCAATQIGAHLKGEGFTASRLYGLAGLVLSGVTCPPRAPCMIAYEPSTALVGTGFLNSPQALSAVRGCSCPLPDLRFGLGSRV